MSTEKNTIVVTDSDWMMLSDTIGALEQHFPEFKNEPIKTEHEFYSNLGGWALRPPSLFVLESRLAWTEPSPDFSKPPEELIKDGPVNAGHRCLAALGSVATLKSVPVVVYSLDGFRWTLFRYKNYENNEQVTAIIKKDVDYFYFLRAVENSLYK